MGVQNSCNPYTYHYTAFRLSEEIDHPPYSGEIAVIDMERTIIDSIKDMNKISGIEEVLQNIESIQHVNEEKLLQYLSLYQNQFLYQKPVLY